MIKNQNKINDGHPDIPRNSNIITFQFQAQFQLSPGSADFEFSIKTFSLTKIMSARMKKCSVIDIVKVLTQTANLLKAV